MKDKINIINPKENDILKYDGEKWVNSTLEDLTFIPSELTDFSDVLIRNVKSNQYLKYDGTGWVNAPLDIDLSFLENNLEDLDLKTDTLESEIIGVVARIDDLERDNIFINSRIDNIKSNINSTSKTITTLEVNDYSFFKNIILDFSKGNVFKVNIKSSRITWNFVNVPEINGTINDITIIVDSHFENIYTNDCFVNGNPITNGIRWEGGSPPSASNNYDMLKFSIMRDISGIITILGKANLNFS